MRRRPHIGPATRPCFCVAVAVVLVWIVTGPIFHYSDTWQLVINTGTTIVTFLMVFLIQNTQNRDTMALQLKLSELVLAMKGAQNKFAAVEDLSDEELAAVARRMQKARGDHHWVICKRGDESAATGPCAAQRTKTRGAPLGDQNPNPGDRADRFNHRAATRQFPFC